MKRAQQGRPPDWTVRGVRLRNGGEGSSAPPDLELYFISRELKKVLHGLSKTDGKLIT